MATEEKDRAWSKGLWESRIGGSSTVPFTLELNVFEEELDKFVSSDGTLNIYAQVSPSPAAKKTSRPGGANNASNSKRPKHSKSSSSARKVSLPTHQKVSKLKTGDSVAIRNESGGLWFGRLLQNLNVEKQESARIQWYEEVGKGQAAKLKLTNSKDQVPTQSIHPAPVDLSQDASGLFKFKDPRMVKQITELYAYAPL